MVNYKLVTIIFDALGLTKIIINIVVRYHNFSNFIITNQGFFLSQNSGHHYIIFLALNKIFLISLIFK